MTNTLQRMYKTLAALRVYRLQDGSLIDSELAAYDAAFAVVEEALTQAAEQAAVQTATGEALARYEQLVGLTPRYSLDDETRRSLVLYRLGSAPFDFHREGMINSIRAVGMEAELVEHFAEESLTVRYGKVVDQTLDLDNIKANIRTVLPAHLDADFDMGHLTWAMFDAAGLTWDELDAIGFTWTEFDLNGQELLGQKEE